MKKFDIPEIPHELVVKAKLQQHKVWEGKNWNQEDPCITINWDDSDYGKDGLVFEPKRMVEDAEYDLAVQLRVARRKIEMLEAGSTGPGSFPSLNLIHFGTGPIATAFGAEMVMQTGIQPHFEPAVHDAGDVQKIEKPDLYRSGRLGAILDRIEFFNEATQGKIPISISDNAGPWSIATSVWHYEDMLEGIYTCPEAVRHLLKLVTEAIIEVDEIQMETARNAWGVIGDTGGGGYPPRGAGVGDDVMVTVSTPVWKEFFLPYNEILSRKYGGIIYHCCMKHDWQLKAMSETTGFMGFDAYPAYNDHDKIEEALTGKGVWNRSESNWELIKKFKGKFGLFLGSHGHTKEEAIENAKKMMDYIHH
ncbi:MAG: uroporphyrinogen decarboxylase family protein, partial [Oscillospiraceae bacterium]|nr:uroporphyrinogen decarboxylase family protein [Oscillospiraceae bacterium]